MAPRPKPQARAAIKDIVEMPDMQIDRIIRSVEANQGHLTKVMAKEMPLLADPDIWGAIVEATTLAFKGQQSKNGVQHGAKTF